jgi:hypothetical protein
MAKSLAKILYMGVELTILVKAINVYNKRQCPRQQNNQQQQLVWGREFFRENFLNGIFLIKSFLPKSSLAS